MKTLFTKTSFAAVTLAAVFFAQNANAKIGKSSVDITPAKAEFNFDLASEINSAIDKVVNNVDKPAIRKTVNKQLAADHIQLKTDELVRGVNPEAPKLKFKVVVKD